MCAYLWSEFAFDVPVALFAPWPLVVVVFAPQVAEFMECGIPRSPRSVEALKVSSEYEYLVF